MRYGLDEKTIEKIQQTFNKHKTISEAILYGSRAKGNFKEGSDIDLTLKGNSSLETLNQIRNDLDNLNLPYTFDLYLFAEIDNQALLDHIKRVGTVFYSKTK